jgi:hypothetical protein
MQVWELEVAEINFFNMVDFISSGFARVARTHKGKLSESWLWNQLIDREPGIDKLTKYDRSDEDEFMGMKR